MKLQRRFVTAILLLHVSSFAAAESVADWLIGEWSVTPNYILRHVDVGDTTAIEPTIVGAATNDDARMAYEPDGNVVTLEGRRELWNIEREGDGWVIIRITSSDTSVLYTIIRRGDDSAEQFVRLPSGALISGRLRRIEDMQN